MYSRQYAQWAKIIGFAAIGWLSLSACGSAQVAEWQGGAGNWASGNWAGIASGGGYPGDSNHRDKNMAARISSEGSEVTIEDGNSIEMSGRAIIAAGTVKQTGGTAVFGTLDVRGQYILEGGSLNESSFMVSKGGEVTVLGGELNAPHGELRFSSELGTFSITGGEFTMRNIFMGDPEHGEAVLRVVGSSASLQVWSFSLHPDGGISRAEFVFDKSGVSTWQIRGGGGALKLTGESGSAHLLVDVSTCPNAGSDWFPLFQYGNPRSLLGTFSEVTVIHGSTVLKPGSQNSLKPGEYYLDLGSKEIAIIFNNTGLLPAPATAPQRGKTLP